MPTSDTATPADNTVLSEQVYDMLMGSIEPDLLLANIPLLDAKYAGESADEKAERLEKYKAAYKKFDADLASFMTEVDGNVRTAQRTALKEKESQDRTTDEDKLASLTSAFN